MDSHSLLEKIPLEILLQVSSYLSTPDLGSLRRTCKHVEASLFNSFSVEFFTRKQFMLSTASLQVLIDISNHPRLSQCLSHVVIGLDFYENGRLDRTFREAACATRYDVGLEDQIDLLETDQDREMLAQAFGNLPNLQTVGLQDYNSGGRVRDGCEWTSYGASTVFQETGIHLISESRHVSDNQKLFASRGFRTILCALGQSGAKPQSLEVFLRKWRSGIRGDAFDIPNLPSVTPVLSNLKTLLLGLDLFSRPMLPTPDDGNGADVECPNYHLKKCLRQTPNLMHLRLNFQNLQSPRVEQFLLWLGSPVTQANSTASSSGLPLQSPESIALSHLRRLDFGMLTVSPHVLLSVIHKFQPTLRELSLWKVRLRPPPDQEQRLLDEQASLWTEFFAQLADFDYLSVGCLSQLLGNQTQLVKFRLPASQAGELSTTREYSGYEMMNFPKGLLEDLVVDWPEADSDTDTVSVRGLLV